MLLTVFPGLQNVYKTGLEKEKVVNLFSRINPQELKSKTYELPKLPAVNKNQETQEIIERNSLNNTRRRGVFNSL
jgi:hypothetical protein